MQADSHPANGIIFIVVPVLKVPKVIKPQVKGYLGVLRSKQYHEVLGFRIQGGSFGLVIHLTKIKVLKLFLEGGQIRRPGLSHCDELLAVAAMVLVLVLAEVQEKAKDERAT